MQLPVNFVNWFSLSAKNCSSARPAVTSISLELANKFFWKFLLKEHAHFHYSTHVTNFDTTSVFITEIFFKNFEFLKLYRPLYSVYTIGRSQIWFPKKSKSSILEQILRTSCSQSKIISIYRFSGIVGLGVGDFRQKISKLRQKPQF